jgi:DNA-binding CsgD family transcriptional regulator
MTAAQRPQRSHVLPGALRDVLLRIAFGQTSREIGAARHTSHNTVRNQTARLHAHYDVASKAALVRAALLAGDVSLDDLRELPEAPPCPRR